MDTVKEIKMAFEKQFPKEDVYQITDYKEKNIYVIYALPKGKTKVLDHAYSMDKASLKVTGGFNPLLNDPNLYYKNIEDRIIYKDKKQMLL